MALSRERVCEELTKAIDAAKSPSDYFRLLTETGLIYEIAPEFKGMETIYHDKRGTHYGESVYQHTLDVLNRLPRNEAFHEEEHLVLTLAAIFHDVGKTVTVTEEEGKIKFLQHESASAEIAKRRLYALRFPSHVVTAVTRLVTLHMKINTMTDGNHQLPRRALSRLFVYDLPQNPPLGFGLGGFYQLLQLCSADQNTHLTLPDGWLPDIPLLTGKDILTYTEMMASGSCGDDEAVEHPVTRETPPRARGKTLKLLHFLQLSQGLDKEQLLKQVTGAVKTYITQEEQGER